MYAFSVNLKTVTARFGPSLAFLKPLVRLNCPANKISVHS